MSDKKVLFFAFLINIAMIFVDVIYGLIMNSSSLIADAAHNSGDAFILGASILVVSSKSYMKNNVSALKGIIMFIFGIIAFYHIYKAINFGSQLHTETLLGVGIFSLLGNVVAAILTHSKNHHDINMKSAYVCARNDSIASAGIVLSGFFFWLTGSNLPDILIGAAIAFFVCYTSFEIIKESIFTPVCNCCNHNFPCPETCKCGCC